MVKMESDRMKVVTLPNGLRVVCQQSDGLASYCGVNINAGSACDLPGKEGTAHFLEHNIFKGTDRRSGREISECIEMCGGSINAGTSRRDTAVYARVPHGDGNDETMVDVIADILTNARFPKFELEKEKRVVIEEIHGYQDDPVDCLYTEFESRLYLGSPYAHEILGTEETVSAMTPADCRDFVEAHYRAGNMSAYFVSPMQVDRSAELIERYFEAIPSGPKRDVSTGQAPLRFADSKEREDAHQTSCLTGMRVFGLGDPRRMTLNLVNHYLVGGMKSVLVDELREKRGLVYSVSGGGDFFCDSGDYSIFFGTSHDRLKECLEIIQEEIGKIRDHELPETTIEQLKREAIGKYILSFERPARRAAFLAKNLLYLDRREDVADGVAQIRAITPEAFHEVARLLDFNKFSTLAYV